MNTEKSIAITCFTGATLGAVLAFQRSYFCGNALVGGGIGAVCGLVNYKLVSVRLPKVVKA